MTQADVRRVLGEMAGEADELRVRLRLMEEARLRLRIRIDVHAADAGGGEVIGDEIEALIFEVMLEATKGTHDDLKAIMANVKAINAAKQALRETTEAARSAAERSPCPPECSFDIEALLLVLWTAYGLDIDREADSLIEDLESMTEVGEMESLRLQMAMDRLSKMMSTLSNMLKKIADTQNQLVQNLK